jgi:hypothetical protein
MRCWPSRTSAPGWPVPETGRPHDISGLTADELDRARRELRASLALTKEGSPALVPIVARLDAVEAELAQRGAR